MQCLLIDDFRAPETVSVSPETTEVARDFLSGIRSLTSQKWDILYLDHDLGDPDEKRTGYGIMCFLEEFPQYLPNEIVLVTSNPVGRKNMQMVIDRLYA